MTNEQYLAAISEAALILQKLGKKEFSRQDIISLVTWKFKDAVENTINPMIQGLTDNLKGGSPYTEGMKPLFHSVERLVFFCFKCNAE